MRHDVDTLGVPVVKLGVAEYMTLAHRANTVGTAKAAGEDKKDPAEPKELRWTRNGLWIVGCGFAAGGLFLTAARVEGWFAPDTSSIVWAIALMLLSAVCAAVVQVTINRRVVLAAVNRLVLEAKEELRAEIRDHAPADAIELARIATMVERVSSAVLRQGEHLAGLRADLGSLMLMKADAERFVDARSEAEEGHVEGVASVTHLPVVNRSPLPRNRDHS